MRSVSDKSMDALLSYLIGWADVGARVSVRFNDRRKKFEVAAIDNAGGMFLETSGHEDPITAINALGEMMYDPLEEMGTDIDDF